MAEKRMFSRSIVEQTSFTSLSPSAQSLYFFAGLYADDDGFVRNMLVPRTLSHSTDDDLKILVAKGFFILFESGVFVVTHWGINNTIKSDRYKPTTYQNEYHKLLKKSLGARGGFYYVIKPRNQMSSNMETNRNIEEERIDEIRKEEQRVIKSAPPFSDLTGLKQYAKQIASSLNVKSEIAEQGAESWFRTYSQKWQTLQNPEQHFISWLKREMPSSKPKERKKVAVQRTAQTRLNVNSPLQEITYTEYVYEDELENN